MAKVKERQPSFLKNTLILITKTNSTEFTL
jgi:hypothetical protein